MWKWFMPLISIFEWSLCDSKTLMVDSPPRLLHWSKILGRQGQSDNHRKWLMGVYRYGWQVRKQARSLNEAQALLFFRSEHFKQSTFTTTLNLILKLTIDFTLIQSLQIIFKSDRPFVLISWTPKLQLRQTSRKYNFVKSQLLSSLELEVAFYHLFLKGCSLLIVSPQLSWLPPFRTRLTSQADV
jgi:hypothetical protein